jgi:hypothetical protein
VGRLEGARLVGDSHDGSGAARAPVERAPGRGLIGGAHEFFQSHVTAISSRDRLVVAQRRAIFRAPRIAVSDNIPRVSPLEYRL